ncbi:unnamed protein product [Trypanosoma congolense IL3000]|uniref:WGS project CAEQ00000000 data, annotated contig 1135 n=1 Tax=Trypanosoma congolense (strain IL3000) TaxID=1068625 RepID=F9W415_TRYCI|nr:unnamed protein product [Trypanosoma congolense IL3000]
MEVHTHTTVTNTVGIRRLLHRHKHADSRSLTSHTPSAGHPRNLEWRSGGGGVRTTHPPCLWAWGGAVKINQFKAAAAILSKEKTPAIQSAAAKYGIEISHAGDNSNHNAAILHHIPSTTRSSIIGITPCDIIENDWKGTGNKAGNRGQLRKDNTISPTCSISLNCTMWTE